jgi:hypothetical protein
MLGLDSFHRAVFRSEGVHTSIFGMTGMGKSTLIEHLLDTRKGLILFDADGSLSDRVLGMIPRDRGRDVIVIDPLAERVPGISFLGGERDKEIRVQNVVQFFRNNWKDSWGARSEWLIANLTYALLAGDADMLPHFGFASLRKLIGSPTYREHIGKGAGLFGNEFIKVLKTMPDRFRQEVTMPILGKLDMMVRDEQARVLFGQSNSSFSFAESMDKQRIIIVRIPAGELGDMSRMLGSAIFTMVTREALLRKNHDPYLMVLDELQEYTKGIDLGRVLATSRKYGLFALMATTDLSQVDDQTLASMMANSGVLASFRTSAMDAKRLAPELGTDMQPRAIQELQQFHCLYARRGEYTASTPVILRVSPPRTVINGRGARIYQASLKRWGRPRQRVLDMVENHMK